MKNLTKHFSIAAAIASAVALSACAASTPAVRDDDHAMMDHDTGMDHMTMSMDDMSKALEGKTGDDFDKAFIEMMIPHHQGAIDMALLARRNAKHQEIKDLADDILAAQQKEIDMMNGWLESWGYVD